MRSKAAAISQQINFFNDTRISLQKSERIIIIIALGFVQALAIKTYNFLKYKHLQEYYKFDKEHTNTVYFANNHSEEKAMPLILNTNNLFGSNKHDATLRLMLEYIKNEIYREMKAKGIKDNDDNFTTEFFKRYTVERLLNMGNKPDESYVAQANERASNAYELTKDRVLLGAKQRQIAHAATSYIPAVSAGHPPYFLASDPEGTIMWIVDANNDFIKPMHFIREIKNNPARDKIFQQLINEGSHSFLSTLLDSIHVGYDGGLSRIASQLHTALQEKKKAINTQAAIDDSDFIIENVNDLKEIVAQHGFSKQLYHSMGARGSILKIINSDTPLESNMVLGMIKYALTERDMPLMQALLKRYPQHPAQPHIKDQSGKTALHQAASKHEPVTFLLEVGGKSLAAVKDNQGRIAKKLQNEIPALANIPYAVNGFIFDENLHELMRQTSFQCVIDDLKSHPLNAVCYYAHGFKSYLLALHYEDAQGAISLDNFFKLLKEIDECALASEPPDDTQEVLEKLTKEIGSIQKNINGKHAQATYMNKPSKGNLFESLPKEITKFVNDFKLQSRYAI